MARVPAMCRNLPFAKRRARVSLLAGGRLPAECATLDCLKRTGESAINRGENLRKVVLDDRPVIRRESHNRQSSPREVLLIDQALIAGNKDLDAALLRGSQQFAVFQVAPSHVGGGDDLVLTERAEVGS